MSRIDDHAGLIEAMAASASPYVTYGEAQRLDGQVSQILADLPKGLERPVLAVVEHEALQATAGSILSSPRFSKAQLDVYRDNLELLRAAVDAA